jgi:hypothetical protein
MKRMIIPLLIFLLATSYANSQTVVHLLLPKNCSSSTTAVKKVNLETESKLMIFPNPNNGNFTLNVSFAENIDNAKISIYNFSGQLIYTEFVFCRSLQLVKQINLQNLSSGTYVVNFKNANYNESTKLIIK